MAASVKPMAWHYALALKGRRRMGGCSMNLCRVHKIYLVFLIATITSQSIASELPFDLFVPIFSQIKNVHEFPWNALVTLIRFRLVCTEWSKHLTDDAIAEHLEISPMHFAAGTGNITEVIRLKLD